LTKRKKKKKKKKSIGHPPTPNWRSSDFAEGDETSKNNKQDAIRKMSKNQCQFIASFIKKRKAQGRKDLVSYRKYPLRPEKDSEPGERREGHGSPRT